MTNTANNGGAGSASGQDGKSDFKPEVFSNNQRELLLNKQLWLDAKDKAERLIMAHEQKFMPTIARTLDLLNVLVEVGLKEFSQQQLAFYVDDILFTVIKNLLEHREYQHEENYLIAESILLKTLEMIAKNTETDYPKISDLLVFIFDASRSFYSKDVVLRPSVPHTYYPLGTQFVRDEKRRAWEESLEVGSIIDCVKIDSTSIWSRAQIKTISESMIRTTFIEDESEYRIVVHSSHQIAPLGSRSKDFEWRQSLSIGDEIDASDCQGVWHKSTIIGERFVSLNETSKQERMLVIGFRQYTNGFNPDDPNSMDFVGLGSLFDASFSPHSPRLMRLNKISRKEYPPANRFGSKYYPLEPEDYLFEEDNKINKIYAIHRGISNSNIVRYVNYFGQIGGFDTIIKRMQKGQADTQPCPLEQIQKYLEAITNIQKIFYIEYAQEMVIAIWEALSASLQSPTEQYLRTYEKERLENIINYLEQLLSLAYSGQDKINMIESLSLSLSLKCYQSDVLKLRIVGLKLICQIIKYVLQQNHKSDENVEMKSKQFIEWLRKNQVIENLYINQIHSELVNRSSDFLKFLAEENILPDQMVQDIFQAIDRQDEMTKQGFLKLLGETAFWFKPELASSVLRNLQKTDRKDLSSQHIDVIYSLVQFKKYPTVIFVTSADETTPTSNSTTEQTIANNGRIVNTNAISALWYFYELITSNSFNLFSAELKAKIIEKFCNLINLKDCQTQNLPFLHRCNEDIKKNIQVSFLLQIIKKIIETYPIVELIKNPLDISVAKDQSNQDEQITDENSQTSLTRAQIAHLLVHVNKIIDVILANIQVIKQVYRKRIEIANNTQEKRDSLNQFRDEVTERIDFIKFINGILIDKIITSDFLEQVWKDIVEDPLNIDERDIFFKWLRELADSKTIGSVVTEVEGFLQRQLLKNNEFIQHLSYDGFLCYKAMFLTINIEQKKLQSISATTSSNKKYQSNQFGAVTSISGGSDPSAAAGNSNNKDENPNIFDYFLISRPQELHGMDLLWEIVYQNENDKVVESCLQFLINLHLHFESATPKEVLYQVRFDLISNLVTRIRSIDLTKEAKKVKRVIDILQCLLDESEKKGIGHLTPLIGLVKGETQSLSIINEISFVIEGLKRQDIKVESNKSIIELKILIASKVGCSWDQVRQMLCRIYNSNQWVCV